MPQPSRKRQHAKSSFEGQSSDDEPLPLGGSSKPRNGKALTQPGAQEIQLENLIFGKGLSAAIQQEDEGDGFNKGSRKKSRRVGPGRHEDSDDDASELDEDQHWKNDQLFVMDTGAGDEEEDEEDEKYDDEDEDKEDPDTEDDSEIDYEKASESGSDGERILIPETAEFNLSVRTKTSGSGAKKPVWTDPDDATLSIALAGPAALAPDGSRRGTKKLRKLREEVGEDVISGKDYELRLRKQFEKLHPRPMWASLRLVGENLLDPTLSITNPGKSLSDLLRSDTGLVGPRSSSSSNSTSKAKGRLKQGELAIERLRDANDSQSKELQAAIESIQFHPNPRTSVLMTASRDRRVRMFQIDGNTNPLLQTLHVPDLPIQTAAFHPSGSSVLLSGPRPYLYAYDLQAGRVLRSSPWRGSGAVFASKTADDAVEKDLSNARFQPGGEGSRMLAIGGRRGEVHLLDWGKSGSSGGARIGGVRMNANLAGFCWDPSPSGENQLMTLSSEGAVHVWDIRNQSASLSCESIWRDDSLFGCKGLEISPDGRWWSVGSDSGIVNMYKNPLLDQREDELQHQGFGNNLEPVKSVGNLTTASTTLRYNHDGQIMAIASVNKKDALKLMHLPSMKVFSNWPTSGTPLGHITSVDFSTGSQYVALGNSRGKVLLYGLKHYL
ncbi:WD40 repeat-like protein [Violaceomyces palustris]|uniref:WD40 repeat-like protein n=1 Tax=Violaceomyces palustris TaxID=1673888 RepID=A0ACD0P8Q6_9BASI|nr:WD40 repeat-like protein [Violaceomyces palustris]